MKELQDLKLQAECLKENADQLVKSAPDTIKLFYEGKAAAFSDIVLMAELLFKQQFNEGQQPKLNKHDVLRCKEVLEQMASEEYEAGKLSSSVYKEMTCNEKVDDIRKVIRMLNKRFGSLIA